VTHLNKIQQLCTNLNDEPEFVVGHVYGMRQWFLQPEVRKLQGSEEWTEPARLQGHNDFAWDLSQPNQAACELHYWTAFYDFVLSEYAIDHVYLELDRRIREAFFENPNSTAVWVMLEGSSIEMHIGRDQYFDRKFGPPVEFPWKITSGYREVRINGTKNPNSYLSFLRFTLRAQIPTVPHDVTDPRCTCGFYAYTNPEALYENSKRRADSYFGIVKAWGKVTQGTKGFRAEKAQIVGLTVPMSKMTVLKYDDSVYVPAHQFYAGGGRITVESKLPTPSWQWVRSATVPPAEAQLIPTDFPRYSSMDEMFTAYQRLTGNDH
jgi:hypothetical protein